MRLHDGENLLDYGVEFGCAFPVNLPEFGGRRSAVLPLRGQRILLCPTEEKWAEIRQDGIAFLDLLCIECTMGPIDENKGHLHRIALYTPPGLLRKADP